MDIEHIGRYEIIGELGSGGMATVLLGKDSFMDREVAIKLLPRLFMHDPTFKERFQREAKLLAQLEHSAIVPVYDFGYHEEQPYMVNRYMRGGTLLERVSEQGALPIEESLTIISRICSALSAAHKRGTVHRDIKPANILFDDTGQAFIADFGIAKLAQSTSTLTGNTLVGTPAYMSPEQFSGEFKVDGRSDQYSLAIVLFEMLSGELPFKGDTTAKLMKSHLMDDPPSLRTIRSDLPESVEPVVEKALQKKPEDRFPDIEAFHQALADAVRGEPWAPEISPIFPQSSEPDEVHPINVDDGEKLAIQPTPVSEDIYATNILPPDTPPLPPKPKEIKIPKPKSKWLFWLIGGVILVGAIFILFVYVVIPAQEVARFDEQLALGLTQTAIAPESSLVEVWVYCEIKGDGFQTVSADEEVILKYGWIAVTEEQVKQFINAAEFNVFLDDEIISNFEMGEIEEYTGPLLGDFPDIDGAFAVIWRRNVGLLKPGTHYISVVRYLNEDVYDGFEIFRAEDVWESGCKIVVE